MLFRMTDTVKSEWISTAVRPQTKQSLRDIAQKEGRSLTQQVRMILERYVKAKEDDGA